MDEFWITWMSFELHWWVLRFFNKPFSNIPADDTRFSRSDVPPIFWLPMHVRMLAKLRREFCIKLMRSIWAYHDPQLRCNFVFPLVDGRLTFWHQFSISSRWSSHLFHPLAALLLVKSAFRTSIMLSITTLLWPVHKQSIVWKNGYIEWNCNFR